ncbi:MAG: RNA polymerase sigma-54 factor [Paracoccaceae bacterium]
MSGRSRVTIQQTQRLALNGSLQTSIRLLRADAEGLTRFLEEQAAETPALRLDPPPERAPGEWLPRWHAAFAAPEAADVAGPDASLLAHVMEKSTRLLRNPRERQIALVLAESLEPSGWLGRPLPDIAAEAAAPLPEVMDVLDRLQKIDPPGLFARNLSDCLRLQAVETGRMDATLAVMLDHLDLVARADFARLARLAGTDEGEIATRLRLIRSFDPKPGAQFAPLSASHLREPDLVVRRGPSGWDIALNHSSLPAIRVEGGGAEATTARAIAAMVRRRNATLLAVGVEILRRQTTALTEGRDHLVPMTMASVAEAIGLHESTVSRVVAGTAADTPRGTIWLRGLFSAAVGDSSGAALRERLARLVADEDPAQPLDDAELARRLAPAGNLARRTVAKYRADLSIPTAAARRRLRARKRP